MFGVTLLRDPKSGFSFGIRSDILDVLFFPGESVR